MSGNGIGLFARRKKISKGYLKVIREGPRKTATEEIGHETEKL